MSDEEVTPLEYIVEPCKTVEELDTYLQKVFNIEMAWDIVDENSTSSPLMFMWNVYNHMLTGEGPTRHVMAVSRNGGKCLAKGTLVATALGPVEIQNLRKGDIVYDENGNKIRVVELHDQGMQECVNLVNRNKIWATCTINHRWLSDTNGEIYTHQTNASRIKRMNIDSCTNNTPCESPAVSFTIEPAGQKHCYDITVDSATSLYCLQNGLVTHNTLASSLLQYFSMIHFRRDGIQLASTLDQTGQAISYLDKFINQAGVKQFQISDNSKIKHFVGLPANSFTTKPDCKVRCIAATKKGANSARASFLCLDAKTNVLVYRDDDEIISSRFKKYTMRGIYQKFNKGECIYVATINNVSGEIEKKRVVGAYRKKESSRVRITTEHGKVIESTLDHRHAYGYDSKILYKHADEFVVGDNIITKNSGSNNSVKNKREPVSCLYCREKYYMYKTTNVCDFKYRCSTIKYDKISKVEYYDENIDSRNGYVYDITVEDNHNFIANGVLTHNCLDEVDLTPPEIISETAFIADPSLIYKQDGSIEKMAPIYIYLSSRKSNSGPIQELIDEAEAPAKKGFKKPALYKWSVVDLMERCPDEVHRPELPSIKAYLEIDSLKTVWGEDNYKAMPESVRAKYREYNAFEGCKTCPAWAACLGRSAKQRGSSFALRTVEFVGDLLASVKSPAAIIAQALNWKPESTGIVFQQFSVGNHYKDPRAFFEWVNFGMQYNPEGLTDEEIKRRLNDGTYQEVNSITPSKEIIFKSMVARGWKMSAGVDFGYNDPAVCVVTGYHKETGRVATLHVEHAYGYANHLWGQYCTNNILNRFPVEFVAPDMADPSANTYFKGFSCLSKKPTRIEPGVSFMRGKLWDIIDNEPKFALLDDGDTEGCNQFAVDEFHNYSHKRNALGVIDVTKFDDNENHYHDAQRYSLAPYAAEKKISYSGGKNVDKNPQNGIINHIDRSNEMADERNRMEEVIKSIYKEKHGLTDSRTSSVRGKGSIKFTS